MEKKNYCDADGVCTSKTSLDDRSCKFFEECNDECCSGMQYDLVYCAHNIDRGICKSKKARKEAGAK